MIYTYTGDYGICFDDSEDLFHNTIVKDKNVLMKLVDDDVMYYVFN